MKKLMLTMILSLAMVAGPGSKSFGQDLSFSFTNITCPGSEVCYSEAYICPCPLCTYSLPCCADIPIGSTSTVTFDGSTSPCNTIIPWPQTLSPCVALYFTVTSGCNASITDTYEISYYSGGVWAGWIITWISGDTYSNGDPVFSFTFSNNFTLINGQIADGGGLDINGINVVW